MTDRKTLDQMNSDDLDQLYKQLDRVRQLHQPVGVVAAAEFGESPDCAAGCGGDWPCATYTAVTEAEPAPAAAEASDADTTTRVFAALHQSAERDVTRVINLYEQWVKAGPPPLGTSIARWWDKRLIELHNTIQPADDESAATKETP